MLTRALTVRSRVVPRPEPPFDRLHDPLLEDLVRAGPLSRERFAVLWPDGAALTALAAARRAPLPGELTEALGEYHRRLGASAASLAALERLARGEAVCAVAGQQPAPFGGPLYALHKAASAVGVAAAVEARTGVPCVPLFWMHGEDSDFAEIRTATLGDRGLELHDLALPEGTHRDGGLVGAIPAAALEPLGEAGFRLWAGLAGEEAARETWRRSLARSRDLGEVSSALMLTLFAEQGLVVVDPRLPAFRAAARPLIGRYLARAETLSTAARHAGRWLEERAGRRPLADAALESFVFEVEDGVRHKLSVAAALALPSERALSPSVALRPAIQDGVFPAVAMACGPGEAAYLMQLREVFEGLDVRAACPVPRLGVTWLPPAAVALLEASGADPWELVAGADAVLRRHAEQRIPAGLREGLEHERAAALAGLERWAAAARAVDASLPQMVESARGKVDYQYARLLEGLTGKLRHRLEREHPEWPRLRYYLMPNDRLQERRLASLELVARAGNGVVAGLCDLAREQAERLARGVHEHCVVDL